SSDVSSSDLPAVYARSRHAVTLCRFERRLSGPLSAIERAECDGVAGPGIDSRSMVRRPGVPRLLREINDRAALELLLTSGPLTRGQIGELTGLSKVTASQTLARLERRGLVQVVGEQACNRGPNAALYGIVPSCAYVAGLDVGPERITAAIADVNGDLAAEVTITPDEEEDPVRLVHKAIAKACRSAKVAMSRLRGIVVGAPGVVDPGTGDVRFSFDLPHWHEGVQQSLAK